MTDRRFPLRAAGGGNPEAPDRSGLKITPLGLSPDSFVTDRLRTMLASRLPCACGKQPSRAKVEITGGPSVQWEVWADGMLHVRGSAPTKCQLCGHCERLATTAIVAEELFHLPEIAS